MAGLMALTIAGNVGNDPEYKTDGTSRLSFRVAVNTWDKTNGEQTTWFGVTAWGAYADSLVKAGRVRKGATVVVSGQLTTRQYQNKQGETVTALDVRPDSVQVFDRKPSGGDDEPPF